MDITKCSNAAVNCKKAAEDYSRSGNFGRAFSHYLIFLKLNPDWKPELKEIFSTVLYKLSIILEKSKKFDDFFKCYELALEIFPENEYILNNLGAHLMNEEENFVFEKMWSVILKKHFPNKRWKKHYKDIIFYVCCVKFGLKPSFLWDFGTPITVELLSLFVQDLKAASLVSEEVILITVDNQIFISNASSVLFSLNQSHLIIDISDKKWTVSKSNSFFFKMTNKIRDKLMNLDKLIEIEIELNDCIPSIFGLLLGYPTIYYFKSNFIECPVDLKVFKLFTQFECTAVSGKFFTTSFSVPADLFNTDVHSCITNWFSKLVNIDNSCFRNIEIIQEDVFVDSLNI